MTIPARARSAAGAALTGLALFAAACADALPVQCRAEGTVLQVLGSGGPIADDGRASSGYLVWTGGRSAVLIDAGGGTFLRFGESGARFDELEHVGLSHFHTDHSADFVTYLKTGFFSSRQRPLGVSGPGPGGPFPGLEAWLDASLGPDGAYRYLGGYLDGSGGLVQLDRVEVDTAESRPTRVTRAGSGGIDIDAIGVPHGIVPAIAYRVRTDDADIVFATDQNGGRESFVGFASGADILVMHLVIPQDADETSRRLHATPRRIGEIAAEVRPGKLVLSHFMARSLRDLDANVALVRETYKGELVIAGDLACIDPD